MNKGHPGAIVICLWGLFPSIGDCLKSTGIGSGNAWCGSCYSCHSLISSKDWQWLRELREAEDGVTYNWPRSSLVNWFIYIWAVNAGYVVEASLGYLSSLVNFLLG